MKRRTLRPLRLKRQSGDHHHVYVVLLDPAAARIGKVRAANPDRDRKMPCVYVGMTGLTPEERFANHKAGTKAASLVTRYGIRLLPELFDHLNPMPSKAVANMEADFSVGILLGGH